MARATQDVTVEPIIDGHRNGGERHSHPAFAQICASRVSGSDVLYGSDFSHQHYIRIRIAQSELVRDISNDWPVENRHRYIEVDMSEAQWATFVSSLNMGSGVQCTLRYKEGETVPGIPAPIKRHDQFAGEIKKKQAEAIAQLDELYAAMKDSGLSAKKLQPMLDLVRRAAMNIDSNSAYVANQFGEHMERVTEAAKAEVNAYALHVLGGAQSNLQIDGGAPPLKIGNKET